jgi:hypothetical protein
MLSQSKDPVFACWFAEKMAADNWRRSPRGEVCSYTFQNEVERKARRAEEQRILGGLIRHILGNPFRPYPTPPHWPGPIRQLAQLQSGQQDVSFALADALEEAGHPELAAHFRQVSDHPKGCWALDAVLQG